MTKTIPAPATPLGASFDPESPLLENAARAWDVECDRQRSQAEKNLKPASRRIFRRDDWEFLYHEAIDPTIPLFELEGEVIAWHDGHFHLVEFCSVCGQDWRFRRFGSLAGLGRALKMRDEDEAYECRDCQMRSFRGKKKAT